MAEIFTLHIKYMQYIMSEYETNPDNSFSIFWAYIETKYITYSYNDCLLFWADKIILTETSLMGFHQPLYHAYASPKIWMRKWFYVYNFPWFLLSCTYNIGNPIFVIAWQGIFDKLLDGHTNFTNYYPFPQEGFHLVVA